ncbi:MAG TPA: hypothetical protein VMH77_02240 [Steroidobacteraceae bacterium]|nr:hypothetical protein [Steroidobacteraceae bacterium]
MAWRSGMAALPGLLLAGLAPLAHAEAQFAVATGLRCSACHVSSDGGGMRNQRGTLWGQTELPARSFGTNEDSWTGELDRHVALGADLRGGLTWLDAKSSAARSSFDVSSLHTYLDLRPIPELFALYVDERLAPGTASNAEAYLRTWTTGRSFYLKAGQLYLPYGIRLLDDDAFIRAATGVGSDMPDRGLETGYEGEHWTTQFALTNGSGPAAETDNGKQWTLRTEYVAHGWRAGASLDLNEHPGGTRRMQNVFGGLSTGPVAWLGELDYIVDNAATPQRRQLAGLVEADWRLAPGQNLKLAAEAFDPDRSAPRDRQTRLSLVWEYTPLPFVQLRAGLRNYDDVQEAPAFNRRILFAELHGYL